MRATYLIAQGRSPLPSLGGRLDRPRPVIPVLVVGPTRRRLVDGLLDTGADETVFPERFAGWLDIDLAGAQEREISLAGRARPLRCRYASVELQISDVHETFQWTAVVGFVAAPLHYALLGYAGFLQFFNAEFQGADQQVVLVPNPSFPGVVK